MSAVETAIRMGLEIVTMSERKEDAVRILEAYIRESLNEIRDARIIDILNDLAYDLTFYEPDPVKRAEDEVFYGDCRLEKEILGAIEKIRGLARPVNN